MKTQTKTKTIWQQIKFKDFADTSPSVKLERGKEYPFIPMDVVDGQNKFPIETKRKKFTGGGSKFANGDTIFARITPCLENGKIAKIKNLEEGVGFGSTEFFVFRGKNGISDSEFVYYLSRTDMIRNPAIKSMVGASGRQRADKSVVENLDILAPSISDQRRIADVLSTYDDLIENNTRRIQILEQMAQAIYTEWFVNFRFPGHEKVKMIDSGTDFGEIPEGWEVSNIGSILDIKSGYSFKSKSYNQTGLYKIVTIKNIHDGKFIDNFNYISDIPEKMPDYCKLMDGDILLSLTGNVGRVCVAYGENLLLNQRVGKIVPNDAEYKSFIYSLFRSDDFKKKLELLSNGVAQQNLSPIQTLNLKIILPTLTFLAEYENIVGELINLSIDLNKQNKNLRQTRDLLLPKLVTGEIRV